MPDTPTPKPPPAHRSKLGVGKLVVQGLAFAVAVANYVWDLEFEFTEGHAALVIGVLETVWQGKQHKTRKRLRMEAQTLTGEDSV